MQVGEEELTEHRSEHGCNTQVEVQHPGRNLYRKFKEKFTTADILHVHFY